MSENKDNQISDYDTAKLDRAILQDRMQGSKDDPLRLNTPPIKSDAVNHPAHYQAGGIECIDVIEAVTKDMSGLDAVATGNVIKYMWRWNKKGGIESLKKAAWYLNRVIASKEQ